MAKKAPAFQIYPDDWLSDTQLMQATDATQGRWMRCLCRMWRNPQKGRLEGPGASLCKALGMFPDEFFEFIIEVAQFCFADLKIEDKWVVKDGEYVGSSVTEALLGNAKSNGKVTLCNAEITLINRRMWREQKVKNNNAERQRRFKAKQSNNEKVTHTTPTPTPTPLEEPSKISSSNTHNSTSPGGQESCACDGENIPPDSSKPKRTNYPSKKHPAHVGFKSCFEIYPRQENEVEGWRVWHDMYQRQLLIEPFAIREHIIERTQEDEAWSRGIIPSFANFIKDQRWNDKYQRVKPSGQNSPSTKNIGQPRANTQAQQNSQDRERMALALLKSEGRLNAEPESTGQQGHHHQIPGQAANTLSSGDDRTGSVGSPSGRVGRVVSELDGKAIC